MIHANNTASVASRWGKGGGGGVGGPGHSLCHNERNFHQRVFCQNHVEMISDFRYLRNFERSQPFRDVLASLR